MGAYTGWLGAAQGLMEVNDQEGEGLDTLKKCHTFFLYTVVGREWLLEGWEGMKINMWGVEECGLGEQWLQVMALIDVWGQKSDKCKGEFP